MGVGVWQHQSGADVARGTDRAEDIGLLVALRGVPPGGPPLGPNVSQAALLANPRFILPPKFDRPPARGLRNGLRKELAFFCAPRGRPRRIWDCRGALKYG